MSDYPMLISNKLHSFRNFCLQRYKILFIQYVKEHLILTFYTTSRKEGWLKAGVVGAPICFNNRLMYSPTTSPTGTPPSRRRRMENTIDYQLSNYYFLN